MLCTIYYYQIYTMVPGTNFYVGRLVRNLGVQSIKHFPLTTILALML